MSKYNALMDYLFLRKDVASKEPDDVHNNQFEFGYYEKAYSKMCSKGS